MDFFVAERQDDGSWAVAATDSIPGDYTAQAHQTDPAGNVGVAPSRTFTVARGHDRPTVRINSPFDHGPTDDTTPVISGSAGNAPGDPSQVRRRAAQSAPPCSRTLTAQRTGTAWSVAGRRAGSPATTR